MWIKKEVKEHERTFEGDEYVHYLDYSDSFIGCIHVKTSIYTLYIIYCMSIIYQ